MMIDSLHNDVEYRRLISPFNNTTDAAFVSQIIDLASATSCEFIIATGTLTTAGFSNTILVEDGNNSALSDNAAVLDEFLLGTELGAVFAGAVDDKTIKIGYIGPKRYIRLTITTTGTAGAAHAWGAIAAIGHHRKSPKTTQIN